VPGTSGRPGHSLAFAAVRRIVIIGASGSGKTTLARHLAARLGIRHVDVDALHHGPNWSEPDPEDFRRTIREATSVEGWVADSFYTGKLGDMLPLAADTIIWLDLPLAVVLRRLLWRTLRRWVTQEELWNGNREILRHQFRRDGLIPYAIGKHREYRRTLPARFTGPQYDGKTVHRFRSQHEVDDFVRHMSR
jgi:adenylate kinase family enzyme